MAFRLNTQNLAQRLPPGELAAAAGVCGLQNAAPDAALLSIHARVEDTQPADVRLALRERELVMTYSLRGAMYLLPRRDFPIFTLGASPQGEEETAFFIQGAAWGLKKVGMGALELVDLAAEGLLVVLDRPLDRDELGRELGQWMAARLSGSHLQAWDAPSEYAPGQTLGESLARFALYVLGVRGSYCLAPDQAGKTQYVRADQWLEKTAPELSVTQAAAELARRFLHAYGPSSAEGLGIWAGIHPRQARRAWESIAAECAPVEWQGKQTWLLRSDLTTYQTARQPSGARFLPPHDPYLALPDRATIVDDRGWQKRIWRTVGNPGVVLLNGLFAGLWRAKKKGKVLLVEIEAASALDERGKGEIEAEASALASLRECESVQIQWIPN